MAEMIPESILKIHKATSGEKKIFKILREALHPDDEHYVWYDTPVLGRYSDFVIFSQDFGIIVLEVKDWSKNRFKSFNPRKFRGNFYNENEEVEVTNPLQQARNYVNKIRDLVGKNTSLIQVDGEYAGNIRFPIGKCIAFTNMSRKEATDLGLINDSIIPNEQALFSDDLNFDLDNRDECKNFIKKIKASLKFDRINFPFEPLNFKELQHLRYTLFPEIRIGDQTEFLNINTVKALSVEQEKVAKNIGEGHRILKGVAGSGKSVVLSCRAKYLQQTNPEWKILVICFNLNLLNQLKLNILNENSPSNITITHFHGLVKKITQANLKKYPDEDQSQYNERIGRLLIDYINENSTEKYQAILIDEGQDLSDDWVRGITNLIDPETNSILFCYDPAQNVFGRKRPNWKSVGLTVQGKKPTELKECYRNTKEILRLASLFSDGSNEILTDEDDLSSRLTPNIEYCHSGSEPVLKQLKNIEELTLYLIKAIQKAISSDKYTFKDMGIIITPGNRELLELIRKNLLETFGPDAVTFLLKREEKLNFNPLLNSIKVMYIEGCKGLEFPIAFFIGLDNMPREDRDPEAEKCLAYVGITRAQQHLIIPFLNNQGYISHINNYFN